MVSLKEKTKVSLKIFEGKQWRLAEDHILFTVGRQSAYLKQLPEAKNSFAKLLCSGSQQASAQQAVFLREYLQTVQVNYFLVCVAIFLMLSCPGFIG
jgi:hypothetical protein